MASIDSGGTISADDPSVVQYQTLLDSLHNKTGDSEQAISDETVKGQQILHDKGINITLLDLMKAMDKATSKSYHVHYAEALAALITIMTANQQ